VSRVSDEALNPKAYFQLLTKQRNPKVDLNLDIQEDAELPIDIGEREIKRRQEKRVIDSIVQEMKFAEDVKEFESLQKKLRSLATSKFPDVRSLAQHRLRQLECDSVVCQKGITSEEQIHALDLSEPEKEKALYCLQHHKCSSADSACANFFGTVTELKEKWLEADDNKKEKIRSCLSSSVFFEKLAGQVTKPENIDPTSIHFATDNKGRTDIYAFANNNCGILRLSRKKSRKRKRIYDKIDDFIAELKDTDPTSVAGVEELVPLVIEKLGKRWVLPVFRRLATSVLEEHGVMSFEIAFYHVQYLLQNPEQSYEEWQQEHKTRLKRLYRNFHYSLRHPYKTEEDRKGKYTWTKIGRGKADIDDEEQQSKEWRGNEETRQIMIDKQYHCRKKAKRAREVMKEFGIEKKKPRVERKARSPAQSRSPRSVERPSAQRIVTPVERKTPRSVENKARVVPKYEQEYRNRHMTPVQESPRTATPSPPDSPLLPPVVGPISRKPINWLQFDTLLKAQNLNGQGRES
jgi:hypothetical protein